MTHLAVCASQDWKRVNLIVVGNFVTASQAQRKRYTNVISKISSDNYKIRRVVCFLCFFLPFFFALLKRSFLCIYRTMPMFLFRTELRVS